MTVGPTTTHTCPVCDYPHLSEPPRSPSGGGSCKICWSCGFEFGVSDEDEGYTHGSWRAEWINAGMPWSSHYGQPPVDWDPRAQLDRLMRSR